MNGITRKEKIVWQEYLELIFKISYILLAFATYVTVFYVSPIQSLLVKLTLGLGILVILLRVIKWKDYRKTPGLLLMALMCASFLLSTVMNREYGMTDNLKWLIWMGIQFFGLYAIPVKREKSHVLLEYKILSGITLFGTVMGAIASLRMLPEAYSKIIVTGDGESIITGFMWDRLWGVYTDPNYGALISVIGIFIALGWIIISKRIAVKILCGLSMVANYGYIVFADSRTAHLALWIGLVFFLFTLLFKKIKEKYKTIKELKYIGRIFVAMLVFVIFMGGCYKVSSVLKEDNVQYQKQMAKNLATNNVNQNGIPEKNQKKTESVREEQIEEDASNGRLSLWKSAIEVWQCSPIYGTGYSTFAKYAEEHVPTTYAVNNSQGAYTSLHNEFFNVLAYQGILGILIFVLLLWRLVLVVVKGIVVNLENEDFYPVPMLCCVGTVVVGMVFLLDGLYTNSVSAAVLWIFGGYLVNLSEHSMEEESPK